MRAKLAVLRNAAGLFMFVILILDQPKNPPRSLRQFSASSAV